MISINFASRNYRLLEGLRKGFLLAGLCLAAILVAIFWTAATIRSDIAEVDKKAREIEANAGDVRDLLNERDRIVKELSSMSGLVQSRRFSWTALLTAIENAFPLGVAVDKMDYSRKDALLSLDGQALSPESLRNLMIGLERSTGFKDPYLKHQSIDKGSISFHVVASYQNNTKNDGAGQGK